MARAISPSIILKDPIEISAIFVWAIKGKAAAERIKTKNSLPITFRLSSIL